MGAKYRLIAASRPHGRAPRPVLPEASWPALSPKTADYERVRVTSAASWHDKEGASQRLLSPARGRAATCMGFFALNAVAVADGARSSTS